MVPISVFRSCGSSSSFVQRRKRPTAVTRGSSWRVIAGPVRSSSTTIVRNLYNVKTHPPLPTRRARYSTGPGELSFTATAIAASTGLRRTSPTSERLTSSNRVATRCPELLHQVGNGINNAPDVEVRHLAVNGKRDLAPVFVKRHRQILRV